MSSVFPRAIVAGALGALGALVATSAFADTDKRQERRANAEGGIYVRGYTQEGQDISWGHAVGIVDRPFDDVFAMVVDYANYKEFMPHFITSRVLARRGNRAKIYVEVGVMRNTFMLWGQLDTSERQLGEASRMIEITLIEGNLNEFNAQFTLKPIDGGKRTELTLRIYVDPDMPLPNVIFSRENIKAAGRGVRSLQLRALEQIESAS